MNLHKLDDFTTSYIETALWSSTDDDGRPLDDNYGTNDLSPDCLKQMIDDCQAFQADHADLLTDENCLKYGPDYGMMGRAGHDFWLTRNGHGAGFWDGDWEETAGRKLTESSKAWGSVDLYIGDDGLVHCQ